MTIVRDPITQTANRIDNIGRQVTRSFTESENSFETERGNSYNLNTGKITLTTANESAVAYLKNNEDENLVIAETIVILGTSTGGAGDATITFERNPTGGDIVTTATAGEINCNRNFGTNNTLLADFYKGAEGDTMTGADRDALLTFLPAPNRVPIQAGTFRIPKGASIGVLITPPPTNSSMVVAVAFQCYIEKIATPGISQS